MQIKKKFKNKQKYGYRLLPLSINEKYNLDLNLFPNTFLEGEYSLPKGHMDNIDKNNCIFTKVREFIEETKFFHPYFKKLLENHYADHNFKSFLNDETFILREKWIGLNNKIYTCEYSVFVINSISELFSITENNKAVPFNFFLSFKVFSDCYKYHKKYNQSSNLDRQKSTIIVPISYGIQLINEHKISIKDSDSRIKENDIRKLMDI